MSNLNATLTRLTPQLAELLNTSVPVDPTVFEDVDPESGAPRIYRKQDRDRFVEICEESQLGELQGHMRCRQHYPNDPIFERTQGHGLCRAASGWGSPMFTTCTSRVQARFSHRSARITIPLLKVLRDSDAFISIIIMTSAYIPFLLLVSGFSDALISTDVPTLQALLPNPSSSARVFVPLNNAAYLSGELNTPLPRFHKLDWWDERLLRVSLPSNAGGPVVNAEVRLSCTPSQHISGRTALDQWHALWGAWVVDDLNSRKKVYFAGDTGYRTVRNREGGQRPCTLHSPKLENDLAVLTSHYYLSGTGTSLLLILFVLIFLS